MWIFFAGLLASRLLITMGSGSSAQAYQLTAEEAVKCWEVWMLNQAKLSRPQQRCR